MNVIYPCSCCVVIDALVVVVAVMWSVGVYLLTLTIKSPVLLKVAQ